MNALRSTQTERSGIIEMRQRHGITKLGLDEFGTLLPRGSASKYLL